MPGVKTVHFCELKWQAWALTSFSHSLRSADVDWLLTESFSSFPLRVPCRTLLKSVRTRILHWQWFSHLGGTALT